MAVLEDIQSAWLKRVEAADIAKERQFGKVARRLWRYASAPDKVMLLPRDADGMAHSPDDVQWRTVRINKTRQFVKVLLPYIHEPVPHRQVNLDRIELPPELAALAPMSGPTSMDRIVVLLAETWLNYIQRANDPQGHERQLAEIEALSKGMGVLWHALEEGPYGPVPVSSWGSVDDYYCDPSCIRDRDAGFIVRRRRRSVWQMSQEWGYDPEMLRGRFHDYISDAATNVQGRLYGTVAKEEDRDICTYFEIWSRQGIGKYLPDTEGEFKDLAAVLDESNHNAFVAVMPGMKHPLNLRPEVIEEGADAIRREIEWPLALHEDRENPWPCTRLRFYADTESPYAVSPQQEGLPHQEFIDNTFAWMENRLAVSGRDITLLADSLPDEVELAITEGADHTAVKVPDELLAKFEHLIRHVDFPNVTRDAWDMLAAAERAYEEAVGIDPRMIGMQGNHQERSATASDIRDERQMARPEQFRQAVREFESRTAAKEAQISRLYVQPQTVSPLFGEEPPDFEDETSFERSPLSWFWGAMFNTKNPAAACADYGYTVEAGAGQRKNRQQQIDQARLIMDRFLPQVTTWAQQGMPDQYNKTLAVLAELLEQPVLNQLRITAPQPPQAMAQAMAQGGQPQEM